MFMRNLPGRFTAEQCRSALRQWCLNPKESKGLSTQGSSIDMVVSVFQHFLHLQRQGKRPKVHAKEKGFKDFFSLAIQILLKFCLRNHLQNVNILMGLRVKITASKKPNRIHCVFLFAAKNSEISLSKLLDYFFLTFFLLSSICFLILQ